MTTPSFGLTATERVLPKLALDFTTASLDARITFTRSGATATCIDSSGLIEYISADTPRFDYDPITLACKGLLIEEPRTNLLTYSREFTDPSWLKGSTLTADQTTAPDGNNTADLLTTVGGTNDYIYKLVTVSASTAYTFSCYVKLGTLPVANFTLAFYNQSGSSFIASDVVPSQTPTSSGWTRVTYTLTTPVGCTSLRVYALRNTTASAGLTCYLWGAQLEAGAFATSYIPTTTTALTRNADVATMTGTNFSDWFNASEGTFVCKAQSPSLLITEVDDGTTNNRIAFRHRTAGVNTLETINVGGVAQTSLGTFTFTGNDTVALAYKENNINAAVNGVASTTDVSCAIPAVNTLRLGGSPTTTYNGTIAKFSYYVQRITNAELRAFSQ